MSKRRWSREEDERLIELVKRNVPLEDIAKIMGRSFYSVEHRVRKLGLKGEHMLLSYRPTTGTNVGGAIDTGEKKKEVGEDTHPVAYDFSGMDGDAVELLNILEGAKLPVRENYILQRLGVSRLRLFEVIDHLDRRGFDIKRIVSGGDTLYMLVRRSEPKNGDYYTVLGNIEFPVILSADYHIGSISFSESAFKRLIRDVEEYGVKDVLIAGDLLQGRGVHKVEALDVRLWRIDEQEREAINLLSQIPARVHLIIGNHEEKIKGSIVAGHDPLRVVAMECDNVTYYGSVAKLVEKKTGKTVLMYHASGSPSYALSYKPQRHYEMLRERPDILLIGHFHVMNITRHSAGALLVLPGTLQRENSYLISKGLSPTVGWIVLRDWSDGKADMVIRTPQYM